MTIAVSGVWQAAHELALEVYRVTARYPADERFGLMAQLRRSAASVPANLAEGSGRNSPSELFRFGRIALGSANELEYELLLARELTYIDGSAHTRRAEKVDHVKRMLANLLSTVQAD